jgi:hypothetical protein
MLLAVAAYRLQLDSRTVPVAGIVGGVVATALTGWPAADFRSAVTRPLPGGLIAIGAAVGPGYNGVMTGRIKPAPCPFTPQEREYIRRELDMFFGTLPSVAEGFRLGTWRGGPLAGQPKVPPAVRTMVERGLVEIRIGTRVPKAHFSEAGLAALRLLALDRRYMDPQKFAHVRAELGLETIERPVRSSHSCV